ncbi:MAG: glycerol-3-phosphate acyltransferase [Bacteroidetes bacterium]|nr:glycerol-3-phosphate acyltransferase [Bacteroidota bacterium]MBU1677468.1 glycerol-3-phosphate acyltransferase [Bacteroidota bacterium]MBU2505286.1 glycerol-3-phosphate acyltransferase [Bacteroidota bacterium]
MEYIISILIGYVIGSTPTAYLVLKHTKKIDITKYGSSNVGAKNSYRVSKSKLIGITVFVVDVLKGVLSVELVKYFYADSFILAALSLMFAVIAHCYSPWIRFKGGRGLATSAGGSLVLAPAILALWLIFWGLSFLFRKNSYFASVAASVLTGVTAIYSADILNSEKWFVNPPALSSFEYAFPLGIMLLVIIARHIEPFLEYYKNERIKLKDNVR